jgi:hypothetical protein
MYLPALVRNHRAVFGDVHFRIPPRFNERDFVHDTPVPRHAVDVRNFGGRHPLFESVFDRLRQILNHRADNGSAGQDVLIVIDRGAHVLPGFSASRQQQDGGDGTCDLRFHTCELFHIRVRG